LLDGTVDILGEESGAEGSITLLDEDISLLGISVDFTTNEPVNVYDWGGHMEAEADHRGEWILGLGLLEITVTDGTFEDNEDLIVTDSDLTVAEGPTDVWELIGTIDFEGEDSGAEGYITLAGEQMTNISEEHSPWADGDTALVYEPSWHHHGGLEAQFPVTGDVDINVDLLITPTSHGCFEDGEDFDVLDFDLEVAVNGGVFVSGTVEIEGDNSGTEGYFELEDMEVTDIDGLFTDGEPVFIYRHSHGLDVDCARGEVELDWAEIIATSGTFTEEMDDDDEVVDSSLVVTVGAVTTVSGTVWIRLEDDDDTPIDRAEGYFTLTDALVDVSSHGPDFIDGQEVCVEDWDDWDLDVSYDVVSTVSAEEMGMVRLLLHESNNEWETADDTDLYHQWVCG